MKKTVCLGIAMLAGVLLFGGCTLQSTLPEVTSQVTSEKKSETVLTQTSEEAGPEAAGAGIMTVVKPQDLPGGAADFLQCFAFKGAYDCDDEESVSTLIDFMLGNPYVICDFSLYRKYIDVPSYDTAWTDENFFVDNKFGYKEDGVDWILSNIYNVSDEMMNRFKEQKKVTADVVIEDGMYKVAGGGVGGGFTVVIEGAQLTDGIYTVDYLVQNDYNPDVWDSATAVMEYKTIDGEGYWSIYKNTEPASRDGLEADGRGADESGLSDDELVKKAEKWCQNTHGETAPNIVIDSEDGDEVTIHLFETVEDETGAHNATWDWLYIDRLTGKGTDLTGNEVDLSAY